MKNRISHLFHLLGSAVLISIVAAGTLSPVAADETCMSPYMAKIVGQEDFVYVWTLGLKGLGDEQDKLVTIDANPNSKNYGKIVNQLSVGGRNEAHHSGLTDDRRYLWAASLDTNKIFIFDVHTDPAKPKLHKTITDFVAKSGGVVGPVPTKNLVLINFLDFSDFEQLAFPGWKPYLSRCSSPWWTSCEAVLRSNSRCLRCASS